MARALELASDVRTFGITEQEPSKLINDTLRYEMGEMTKSEAQSFIERVKQSNRKLASKLIVDFEEVYA